MPERIIAGNWKMNTTLGQGKTLAQGVADGLTTSDVTVVLCAPFTHLATLKAMLPSSIKLAAQNCSQYEKGAYTGEISPVMLADLGIEFVVLGHSERREYFHEGDSLLAEKVKAVLEHGMRPIFCCGESLAQREAGEHLDFVREQLTNALFDLSAEQFAKVVIAYEPIWAIGTGVTASSDQAQEMHALLRAHIATRYGKDVAAATTIQYGGSMKPDNAVELLACPDVDGGLIGGASLKPEDFLAIIGSYPS